MTPPILALIILAGCFGALAVGVVAWIFIDIMRRTHKTNALQPVSADSSTANSDVSTVV